MPPSRSAPLSRAPESRRSKIAGATARPAQKIVMPNKSVDGGFESHQQANSKTAVASLVKRNEERRPQYDCIAIVEDQRKCKSAEALDSIDPPAIGQGASVNRREAECPATLSALSQLHDRNSLGRNPSQWIADVRLSTAMMLPDGTEVSYERARHFVEYYRRQFRFPPSHIKYNPIPVRAPNAWQAVMDFGGQHVGAGTASQKKNALKQCYLDVVRNLHGRYPKTWDDFMIIASNRSKKKQPFTQTGCLDFHDMASPVHGQGLPPSI